jgi:hypothetical protein
MRNTVAVAICLSASVVSVYCVCGGSDVVPTIWLLACVWRLTVHWLDRRFDRWQLSMTELIEEARHNRLGGKSRIVRTMDYGFDVLVLSALVLFLIH